jgi:hypothetical protein
MKKVAPSGYIREDQRRTVQIKLRLAPDVAERLRAAASVAGLSISAWVATDPRICPLLQR